MTGRKAATAGAPPTPMLHALLDHTPAMLWHADSDGKRKYFTRAWQTFTGRSPLEESGDGWLAGVHPDDVEHCRETIATALRSHSDFELRYRLRRHDGAWRHVHDLARAIPAEQGGGFSGCCCDKEEAARLADARAVFLSLATHDIRTPLQALKTYLELMQRSLARGQGVPEGVLPRLSSVFEKLVDLVSDLGDVGRLDAGRGLSVRIGEVDLREMLQHFVRVMRETVPPERVEDLRLVVPAEPYRVPADGRRLERAIEHLVNNAVRYSTAGTPIEVRLEAAGAEAVIVVEDRGEGFAAAQRDEVLQPFRRGDNAIARGMTGAGVGLSLAEAIVKAHGGSLTIDTTPGRGTRVTVRLPASADIDDG